MSVHPTLFVEGVSVPFVFIRWDLALKLLQQMQSEGMRPSTACLTSAINACLHGALDNTTVSGLSPALQDLCACVLGAWQLDLVLFVGQHFEWLACWLPTTSYG